MIIGIVGSDDRAKAIGRLLRAGGHTVTFGDPASEDQARRAAAALYTTSDLPYHQAMCSDLLFLAMPREQLDRAVTAVGSGAEAVIVDAVEGERGNDVCSGSEVLARKLDTHRVVRALINMPQSGSNVEICGDDPLSKQLVDRALHSCGCDTTDCGPLATAAEIEAPA